MDSLNNYSQGTNNINLIFVKNLDDGETIELDDYIKLLENKILSKTEYENININVILVLNRVGANINGSMDKNGDLPTSNEDIIKKNGNINFMIVNNILPYGSK